MVFDWFIAGAVWLGALKSYLDLQNPMIIIQRAHINRYNKQLSDKYCKLRQRVHVQSDKYKSMQGCMSCIY
jgi:hypothetical protein